MDKTLDVTNLFPGTQVFLIIDVDSISIQLKVYKWTIEKKIAQGDFNFIYMCNGSSNMSNYKQFALKCESAQSPLQVEYQAWKM